MRSAYLKKSRNKKLQLSILIWGNVNFMMKTFAPVQNSKAVFRYIENLKTKQT